VIVGVLNIVFITRKKGGVKYVEVKNYANQNGVIPEQPLNTTVIVSPVAFTCAPKFRYHATTKPRKKTW